MCIRDRPRGAAGLAKYIRDKTTDGRDLIDFIIAVARGQAIPTTFQDSKGRDVVHKPTLADREWAINTLLNRGFGKPIDTIEIAQEAPEAAKALESSISELSTEKLAEIQKLLGPNTDDK